MLTRTDAKARGLADLPPVESDSLLKLIALANADPRPDKIDVGVGVFRDAVGNTPILKVMKEAEQRLVDTQESKSYLGSAGDKRFAELLRPILLGEHAEDERIAGLQTPGGCGALRLGFELIATANPGARVLVGTPTWPNHPPIIGAVRLEQVDYPYYETGQGAIRFEDMLEVHLLVREKRSRVLNYLFRFSKISNSGARELVATGDVTVVCVAHYRDGRMEAVPIPAELANQIEIAPPELLKI